MIAAVQPAWIDLPARLAAVADADSGRALRDAIAADVDALVDDWLRITAVPAPVGGEGPRAELLAELARKAGADEVIVDAARNVIALRHGEGDSYVALIATLDDLASIAALRERPGAPLGRDGDRVFGPGTNTASSDAEAIALVRAFARTGLRGRRGLMIVCVTGEETGLTGMARLLDERADSIDAVVEILGGVGVVCHGALGAKVLRLHVDGASRHSLGGGEAEVTSALGLITARVREHTPPPPGISLVPPRPMEHDFATLRINQIHAGEVVNHSPASGWLTVGIRGTDQAVVDGLEARVRQIADEVCAELGVAPRFEVLRDDARALLDGGSAHPLVQAAVEASARAGTPAVTWNWASSNVNVAAMRGVPGVALSGGRGDERGTLEEWCDVPAVVAGTQAAALLAAALLD